LLAKRQWQYSLAEKVTRSNVVQVMRHRLCGISTFWLNDIRKRDEHPVYTLLKKYDIF